LKVCGSFSFPYVFLKVTSPSSANITSSSTKRTSEGLADGLIDAEGLKDVDGDLDVEGDTEAD